jgi:hypothetical protein
VAGIKKETMGMNLTEIQDNLIGAWTGNNLLRFMDITTPPGKELQIVMYNCSPEGVQELAVRADYKRV